MADIKKRDYVKISFQDLEIAEKFFQNEKHFNEFFVAVLAYYREKPVTIKSKIVQKYFETYKKTMDFVMKSVRLGYEGQIKKTENETNKSHTLEGVVAAPLEPSLSANIKVISNNIKKKDKKENESEYAYPPFLDFLEHAKSKAANIDPNDLKKKYDAWVNNNWHDGNGKKILNWKGKLNSTIPYIKTKTFTPPV